MCIPKNNNYTLVNYTFVTQKFHISKTTFSPFLTQTHPNHPKKHYTWSKYSK